METMQLLDVKNLSISFFNGSRHLPTVSNVSFSIRRGKILALVGESGCGKSASALSLAGLLPSPPGRVSADAIELNCDGEQVNLAALTDRQLRKYRGKKIAYIFQEPSVSLNPVFSIGRQIVEALELHRSDVEDSDAEAVGLLRSVGINNPEKRLKAYPHELSGGMQQRVMIAMALACDPALLVADEPTTALDVTVQSQILALLDRLRRERDMGILLITHNLGIVEELADDVAVMYAGQIVESSPAPELFANPAHPYTRALLAAVPRLGRRVERLTTIPGVVPSPGNYPAGCRFFGRCALAETLSAESRERCAGVVPVARPVSPGHECACHYSKSVEASS